jgi:hypothetical protein
MSQSARFNIQGHVGRGLEAVRAAFAENFVRRRELGGLLRLSPRREGR